MMILMIMTMLITEVIKLRVRKEGYKVVVMMKD